ncbi:hypothetical protein GCM10022291_07810 [Postechiella marina]|uniref:Uncharacterized protein n=1 Tax=Postechiella marina TaxID=943941 RepID=A0ABP8C308_9FLAO
MKTKENNKKQDYKSDITKDDLQAIGKKGLRADSEADRLLLNRKEKVDFTGKDLDLPGITHKTKNISKIIADEENTLYGQGGESKENLEAPERANLNKS